MPSSKVRQAVKWWWSMTCLSGVAFGSGSCGGTAEAIFDTIGLGFRIADIWA